MTTVVTDSNVFLNENSGLKTYICPIYDDSSPINSMCGTKFKISQVPGHLSELRIEPRVLAKTLLCVSNK